MKSALHDHQSVLAAAWLKSKGFPIVATELRALGCAEQADVKSPSKSYRTFWCSYNRILSSM